MTSTVFLQPKSGKQSGLLINNQSCNVMKKSILSYIELYYTNLQGIVASRFGEYLDDDYYGSLCSNSALLDDESRVFYFNQLVLKPLKAVLSCVVEKGHISVDDSLLPNEYRLSVGSLADILKASSPRCRRMMLERINCPSSAYSDMESGFVSMDTDALQRAFEKVDFTIDFKRISFLRNLAFTNIQDKSLSADFLDERFCDVLLPANGRPYDEKFQNILTACLLDEDESSDKVFAIAKRLIKECYWNNIACFTSKEKSVINELLATRLFSSFVYECRKEFKKDHPKTVFSEMVIVDKSSKKKSDDMPVNVIMGVRGLAKFVGVGVTKAQEIVNSKILEENGISYWVGRKICFDGEKLATFLTSNPDVLKGKKLSKKR